MPASTWRVLLASALGATALVAAPDLAGAQSEGTTDRALIWEDSTPDWRARARGTTPIVRRLESCLGRLSLAELGERSCTVEELERIARGLPHEDEHWAIGYGLLSGTAGALVQHAAGDDCCAKRLRAFAQRVERVYRRALADESAYLLAAARDELEKASRLAAVLRAEQRSDSLALAAALDAVTKDHRLQWTTVSTVGNNTGPILFRLAERLRDQRRLAGSRAVLASLKSSQSDWDAERWALESDITRLEGFPDMATSQLRVAQEKRDLQARRNLPDPWAPERLALCVAQSIVECALTGVRCPVASPALPGWVAITTAALWPAWSAFEGFPSLEVRAEWEALLSPEFPEVGTADRDVAPWRVRHARRLCAGPSSDCDALLAAADDWSLQWPEDAVLAREVMLFRAKLAEGADGPVADELRDQVRGALEGFAARGQFENDPELFADRAELWLRDLEWRTR